MNARPTAHLLGAVVLACTSIGCVTYQNDMKAQREAREREDMLMLQEDLRRINGRMEGLEMEMDNLRDDLDTVRNARSRTADSEVSSVRSGLADLERRMQGLEAGRQQDKQEIVEKLTGKITEIVKKAPSHAGGNRRAASGYGYEHIVESGQTLSEIAKAYGVTVAAIIEANEMQNPNHVRVGQKLFIPE